MSKLIVLYAAAAITLVLVRTIVLRMTRQQARQAIRVKARR